MSEATIRPATSGHDAALLALDTATWSSFASPAPPPTPDVPFFDRGIAPEDVLDGRYFDDVLMALTLSNEGAA